MKKRVALIVAVVAGLGVLPATAASASCHEIDPINGCVETIVCRPLAKLADCVE